MLVRCAGHGAPRVWLGWSPVALRRPVGSASALPECLWRCHPFPSSANIGKSTRTANRYIALWEGRTKLVRGQPTENAAEGPDTRVGNAEAETLKARIKELEDELEWAREELELETRVRKATG
jgi:hypothetical protein